MNLEDWRKLTGGVVSYLPCNTDTWCLFADGLNGNRESFTVLPVVLWKCRQRLAEEDDPPDDPYRVIDAHIQGCYVTTGRGVELVEDQLDFVAYLNGDERNDSAFVMTTLRKWWEKFDGTGR